LQPTALKKNVVASGSASKIRLPFDKNLTMQSRTATRNHEINNAHFVSILSRSKEHRVRKKIR
jgi:hypothetical protein